MASENLKLDENHKPVAGFVTDDSNQFIKMGRIDDATKGLKVMIVGGAGTGTITSITASTGILLTPNPIVATGTVGLSTALAPIATLAGNSLKILRVNAGETAVEYAASAGGGATTALDNLASVAINTTLLPGADDGAALGSTSKNFSDLFLATGAVINYASSNVVLTHTSGILTMGTGDLRITTAGTNTASVVTVGGTQTLTGKTLTSPTLTTPTLGVATATSINGNTFTTGTYTLTGQAGKTLTFNGSITLTGTDAQTYTFPTTSATIARIDAANTFTGASTASAWVLTSPTITTKISPTSDDGAPLGDTTHNFSDLFLASGAVINIANSDWIATHTAGILTVGTGDLRVTTAGTNTASVVTVGGTQTLTSKVLTSATITTKLSPTSDDGAPLGDTTHNFSDLFLASGGVINWVNGNMTITQSSGLLTVAGGSINLSSTGGDIYSVDITDYSGTSTVVGWSSTTTKVISYRKVGKQVTVWFDIKGTSNATSASFTMPYQNNMGVSCSAAISALDNGAAVTTSPTIFLSNGSATFSCSKDCNGTAWTNSGTKEVTGTFTYYTTQ